MARHKQSVIDKAIDEWCKRLRACIPAKGGHFEHNQALTVDTSSIIPLVSFFVKPRICKHSVAIDLLKLNIFSHAYFQALLQRKNNN